MATSDPQTGSGKPEETPIVVPVPTIPGGGGDEGFPDNDRDKSYIIIPPPEKPILDKGISIPGVGISTTDIFRKF